MFMMKFQQIVPSQNPTNHPESFTLIHLFWSTKMKFWRWNYNFRSYMHIFPSICERNKLLATFGNFKPFWQLLAIFGNFWQILATIGNFWQLLAFFGSLFKLFPTFAIFCQFCQLLVTFVKFPNFWHLLATVDNYHHDTIPYTILSIIMVSCYIVILPSCHPVNL